MPRLEKGQNEKIDRINDLVYNIQNGKDVNDSMTELLSMFKPMILGMCKKWSEYFNDHRHNIKPFNELVVDSEYWFMIYVTEKYDVNGVATFNTFIKNHIDQRIRYIYETELKYYRRLIFPDPDKNDNISDGDKNEMLESVSYNYKSDHGDSVEDELIIRDTADTRYKLAHQILDLLNNDIFSQRDRMIFTEILFNGRTHEEISVELNVSRTRVTQILKKIKLRLYILMNNNQEIWDLVGDADMDFKEV